MNEALRADSLTRRYGRLVAVNRLNLALQTGRIIGLAGDNGAGKSTLLQLAADVLKPNSGSISVLGTPVGAATHGLVSYMPDSPRLPRGMQVRSLISWYATMYADFDREKALALCADVELNPDARLSSLSKGYVERAMLVLCIARQVPLYLLDEPMAGADPHAKRMLKTLLRREMREDACMVISTHLLSDMETLFDEVLFMREGQIIRRALADDIRENSGMSVDEFYDEVMGQ